MVTKVLITRLIQENKIAEVLALLKKLRIKAMNQPGYISGETLINQYDSRSIMVISIWQTLENWNSWQESEEKKANEAQLEKLLQAPAKYEIYDVVSTSLWKLI